MTQGVSALFGNYMRIMLVYIRQKLKVMQGKAFFFCNGIQFHKLFVSLHRKYQISEDNT